MAKNQKQNQAAVTAADMDGNVDKIREILFGGQMRDYEQRFADLETRLGKTIEQMSNNFEKRLERLNTFTKREVEKLNDQVKAERKTRVDDGKKGSKGLKELAVQVESWCAELEEQIDNESRELRNGIQEQNEELSGMIQDSYDEINKSLVSETRGLADSKLARDDLAALLTEVALRIKKDFKLPDA